MRNILLAVILGGLATSSFATTIGLWSTGVCSGQNTTLAQCQGGAGSLLNYGVGPSPGPAVVVSDNNYKLSQRVDGGATGTGSNSTEHAIGTYLADGVGASEWIGPVPLAANEPAGTYTYNTTFDLTGFDPTSLILSLDVSVDNSVQVLINNHDITALFGFTCLGGGVAHPQCYEVFTSDHSINNTQAGGYLSGLNTLTFVVTNADNPSPTGLRVQAQGNANLQSTPEPVTVALVGIGLLGIGLVRRKRA